VYLYVIGRGPGIAALGAFAYYIACLAGITIGLSLASSVLFLRFRDLNQIWDMTTQAGFFVAPIIYPLGVIPERFHFYLYFWPPTPVIEFSRSALLAQTIASATGHAYLALMTAGILAGGIVVFRRLVPRAAEYV
jgi:lipopolysaccharide transport system permease protein